MPDEFEEFLGSADLSTWLRCANALGQRAVDASARDEEMRKAIFACIYACWLSRVSGDLERKRELDATLAQLGDTAVRAYTRRRESEEARLGVGALMAWRGYHVAADEMMQSAGPLRPEAAILVMPDGDAARVLFLRRAGLQDLDPPFAPALYFYGDALLKLRSRDAVEKLLKGHPSLASNSMMLDLQGRLHEEAGRWRDAYEVYSPRPTRPAPWPLHRYRAAIAASIADTSGKAQPELEVDAAMAAQLHPTSYEIDLAELARRSLFVSTCRWNAPDHWVVQLELGHLNFRRRRHFAAHANYRAAAAACPPAARFAVLDTQFANLSWVTHAGERVSMAPETYECGYAAIQAAGDDHKQEAASTQMWLAGATTDPRDLQLVFDEGDAYTQGCAYSMIGEEGEAIRCWIEALAEQYHPRALQRLLDGFVRCRFAYSVGFLIDLVLRESPEDFQTIRELGSCLLGYRKARGIDDARIDERIRDVFARIVELSRYDFQHLFRAHELLLQAGRKSRAATLLVQAGALAEGPEENLAVAKARRELLGAQDSLGLRCLHRAVREAASRFERLSTAVECFEYGQIRRAQRMLTSVRLFEAKGMLEPAEYVLAVKCAPWLNKEEAGAVVHDAITTLRRDVDRGAVARYEHAFRRRLDQAVLRAVRTSVDADLLEWLEAQPAVPESPTKILLEVDEGTSQVAETLADAPVHLKLQYWWYVATHLDRSVTSVASVRPTVTDADTPISKVMDVDHDLRADAVSEHWRDYFRADSDDDREVVRAKIKAFRNREAELFEAWERKRREDATDALDRALYLNSVAEPILESLRRLPERKSCWPMLDGLYASIERDAEQQLKRLAHRADRLRDEFAVPEAPAAGGTA